MSRIVRIAIARIGLLAVLAIVGYLIIWPLFNVLRLAFSNNFAGFRRFFNRPGIGETLRNTLIVGLGSGFLAVVMGTVLAWGMTRLTRRVRRVVGILPLLPLILPMTATVVGWAFLLSPRVGYLNQLLRKTPLFNHLDEGPFDVYSIPGIVIVLSFTLTSFVFIFLQSGLRNMGQDYEKAAAASGASELRTFLFVTLPLLKPSLMYATAVSLLFGFGAFTAPLFLGTSKGISVLTTEIYASKETFPVDYGYAAALSFPLVIVGFVIIVVQRFVIGDQRKFQVAPNRTQYPDRQRSSRLALAGISLYGLGATLLPLIALIHVSLSRFWSGKLTFDKLSLHHYHAVLDDPITREAIETSVRATLTALAFVLPLGFICAKLLRGARQSMSRRLLDFTVNLPLTVPATLFGLGLLYTYTRPPFILYGTTSALVVTYVALMVPHATRLQLANHIAVGNEPTDAAKASGAGGLRTLLRVTIPMTRKGIGAAATMIVILLMNEFSASIMVRSPRSQVLGTVIWDAWGSGLYPRVAVVALLTVVVTIIGLIIAAMLGGRDALGSL